MSTKARFSIVREELDILAIKDDTALDDDKATRLADDIGPVVEALVAFRNLTRQRRKLICRDAAGVWDQAELDTQAQFVRFNPIRTRSLTAALIIARGRPLLTEP